MKTCTSPAQFIPLNVQARFIVDLGLVPVLPRVVEGGGPPIERGIVLCPRPTVQVEDMVL